jgi:hypothetical protein
MAKEKSKSIFKYILGLLGLWFIWPNLYGLTLFSILMATHQIQYAGIASTPRLPLTRAFLFEYTPTSLLHFAPFAGLTSGIFVVIDPNKSAIRSDVLTHELRHVWQFALYGPLKVYSSWNQLHGLMDYSYWEIYLSNPWERDAFNFAGAKSQSRYNELIDQHAPKLAKLKFRQHS